MMKEQISKRDWEALSAFIDGQLSQRERSRLEARLQTDAEMRAALRELRLTRQVLRSLPRLRAPRNFTLSHQVVKQPLPSLRLSPVFGIVSALSSLLLLLVIFVDGFNIGVAMPVAFQEAETPVIVAAPVEPVEEPMMMEAEAQPVEEEAELKGAEEPSVREVPAEAGLEVAEEIPEAEPAPLMLAEEQPTEGAATPEEESISGVSADFFTPDEPSLEEAGEPSLVDEAESILGAEDPGESAAPPELQAGSPSPEIEVTPEVQEVTQTPIPAEDIGETESSPVPQNTPLGDGRGWLRWVEIVLVLIALISGVVALSLRRRGG
jgi:anti-sigma factor RsiW